MSDRAYLGTDFTLGDTILGAGYGEVTQTDLMAISSNQAHALITAIKRDYINNIQDSKRVLIDSIWPDTVTFSSEGLYVALRLLDALHISDTRSVVMDALRTDSLSISEKLRWDLDILESIFSAIDERLWYPNQVQVAVLARIVLALDITSQDICEAVLESGMSIYVNGTAERAFLFPKQVSQKFDNGKHIIPGDAVMFSCPTLTLALGDQIYHNNIYYEIIAFKDEFIGGNHIYRKSGLKRLSPIDALPQVTGVMLSPNLEGKTTMTWDVIEADNLSHYLIGKVPNILPFGALYANPIHSLLNTPPAEVNFVEDPNYYLVDTAPTGAWVGNANKVAKWNHTTNVWNYTTLTVNQLAYVVSATNYYYLSSTPAWWPVPWILTETTKSNSYTDKNLVANYPYVYIVWAIDHLGNRGPPSIPTTTPIDNVPPPAPGGLR